MKVNEGTVDRVVRGIVGAVLLVVGIWFVGGTVGIVLDVLGAILLITGIIGFCPIYALLHVGTSKKA